MYPAELNSHGTCGKIWNTTWHWLITTLIERSQQRQLPSEKGRWVLNQLCEIFANDTAGFKNFALFLVYESYEISRYRNQNLEITTKATKFLGDLEITTKFEILRWTNHTILETLSPTNSHQETFSKFLAVLGLPKILAVLEGSEQIFPRKWSLGAPELRLLLLIFFSLWNFMETLFWTSNALFATSFVSRFILFSERRDTNFACLSVTH